jgi:hypothetical protein
MFVSDNEDYSNLERYIFMGYDLENALEKCRQETDTFVEMWNDYTCQRYEGVKKDA